MTWQRVRAEFEALLERPDPERQRRLAELEATDAWLARQLRDLLAHDGAAGAFLERAAEPPLRGAAGARLGRHRLVRPLGTGGMGSVWEAESQQPLRRVALKLVPAGHGAAERWRFQHEVQVLARLRHPAIATFFDAGTATLGGGEVAWLSMELVEDAADVATWVRERALPRAARLELFARLCDAVAYGHRHGVLHRDLKPSNVLVGADGQLKLIDFGVARALGADTGAALRTRTGEIVGTLQFMAPEQLRGSAAVGTAADVYALGGILYQLLCDRAPFDFGDRPLAAIAKQVLDDEPIPPRTARPDLPADLGWIVLRALEKDPARRYPTVDALAADLERWRTHEPVLARPAGVGYRAVKFVRRHRVGVAIAAALAGGIAIAFAGLWRGLAHAREGELLALQGAEHARQGERAARRAGELSAEVLRVAMGLFEGIDETAGSRDVTVHELLDAAVVDARVTADPELEIGVRAMRGNAYARVGRAREAAVELERALSLQQQVDVRTAADAGHAALGLAGTPVLQALLGGALASAGEHERGEQLVHAALAASAGGHDRVRDHVLRAACQLCAQQNRDQQLLQHAAELAAIAARTGDRATAFHADRWTAKAASALQRHADAVPAAERAWSTARELFGADHKLTATAFANLVNVVHESGDLDRAEAAYPQLIEQTRRVFGADHEHLLTVLNNQVGVLWRRNKVDEAIESMRAIVAAHEARGGAMTVAHLQALHNLGQVLNMSTRFADAEPLLARAAAASRTLLAAGDPDGARMRFNHGACLAWNRRLAEAEPILLAEFEALQRALPADHADVGRMRRTIADAYRHNGRPDAAAAWGAR